LLLFNSSAAGVAIDVIGGQVLQLFYHSILADFCCSLLIAEGDIFLLHLELLPSSLEPGRPTHWNHQKEGKDEKKDSDWTKSKGKISKNGKWKLEDS
jgi:hypothetical protein